MSELELLKEKIAKSNKYVLYIDYSDLLDLLNIIENQQKEIEKLNFENHMVKKWNEQLDQNCISKDKIRKIINKYVDIDEHLKYTNQELYGKDLKNMINELLEEN